MRPPLPPHDEPPTGRTNQPLTLYQALLARFDPLSDPERTDLLELVCAWSDATELDRALILALARRLAAS